jgi:N-6 DNA Methylase/Eco57I restriction-modification methylase
MIPGVQGRLLTASFIRDVLPTVPGISMPPPSWSQRLAAYSQRIDVSLGSASSVRAVTDVAVLRLVELLGLRVVRRTDGDNTTSLELSAGEQSGLTAVTTGWGEPLERVWRSSVISAIGADVRWCLCCNGQALRIIDARRTWSRDYLEFDLVLLGRETEAQSLLWCVAHAGAFRGDPALLDTAVTLSRQHGMQVCRALGDGVLDALEVLLDALGRGARLPATALWEQSLTVLYRVLFLLFAEARGLVPLWHPVYRDRYSLEVIVACLLEGRPYKGLWRAVHAISRLAHSGCSAGELKVTAFNGRLFAPAQAAAFDNTRLSDVVMARTVIALSTTPVSQHGARTKITYRDLDVEQLGAVYERVLEYEPTPAGPTPLSRTRDIRKSSGSFYTPRALTTFLVRRTLEPLVRDRAADQILALRILDPAMGSGAFLVAACRYLASAAEEAIVRDGHWHAHDVTAADRVNLRRQIASRCLFGVDLNPMAVQLARLSLWLATLAADKPLSFLDHHLVSGHSLIGATPEDMSRQPGGGHGRKRQERLSLFDEPTLPSTLARAALVMTNVSTEPDDSADVVRAKERTLAALQTGESSLTRWKAALDLWCAAWFWPRGKPPDRAVFHDLVSRLLERPSTLPHRLATHLLAESVTAATRHRFLHWPLTFPDVFSNTAAGRPPGFDAVIGNPPWDMVRGDSGAKGTRAGRRVEARQMSDFVRHSGIYEVESRAHVNLYQLFIERALQLVRPGGRIGFVVPSGVASDAGAAPLRRHLLDRAEVDDITGLDNRLAIFPVHRSVRFVLFTCTPGRATTQIRCQFGLTRVEELGAPARAPLVLSRRLLAKLSGEDDLGIPELANETDLAIVEAVSTAVPRLGTNEGWHVAFGRELNASDDRGLFAPIGPHSTGRPVVEGKQIDPFRVAMGDSRSEVRTSANADRRVPRRARLAYRDVASATNRLTLIAAIIPARAVTTHTLFCLRTPLPLPDQRVLCGLLNSYVANYLIRFRVNTHVTVSLVSRLPVPLVLPGHPLFERLAACAGALARGPGPAEEMSEYAELQAIAAHLYQLSPEQFEHVLSTFPLVPGAIRGRALQRFIDFH